MLICTRPQIPTQLMDDNGVHARHASAEGDTAYTRKPQASHPRPSSLSLKPIYQARQRALRAYGSEQTSTVLNTNELKKPSSRGETKSEWLRPFCKPALACSRRCFHFSVSAELPSPLWLRPPGGVLRL